MRSTAEASREVLAHLDRVRHHLLQRQRRCGIEGGVRLAAASLVPGRHHEVLLQAGVEPHGADVRAARSAREVQQHRQRGAAPTDHDRLRLPADHGGRELRDAARHDVAVGTQDGCGRGRPRDHHADGGDTTASADAAIQPPAPSGGETGRRAVAPRRGRSVPRAPSEPRPGGRGTLPSRKESTWRRPNEAGASTVGPHAPMRASSKTATNAAGASTSAQRLPVTAKRSVRRRGRRPSSRAPVGR
jgi:hypothetical protein